MPRSHHVDRWVHPAAPEPDNLSLESVLRKLERHSNGYVFHGAKGARLRTKRVLDIFKREIRNT